MWPKLSNLEVSGKSIPFGIFLGAKGGQKVHRLFVCVLMMSSDCGSGLGEGPNFTLVEGLKSDRGSSLMQLKFV